ncbi:LysR family transcriptional regulator [Nocardioides immobilis]|uniref:LysR family transcriptional regulator n=1 Tax=Nocardioides immobilis TaxID=2049295 RepID=A0A417Y8S5_9ACTN|nr:LysR family transcriptional regulator [Nocardioides immobilis]RHW29170.1 LysR family transcriptional regulator [Nocardioides immobilis]
MLELRQLRYFTTVAELGSLSRAAEVLHMTQPSLSRQLTSLERSLGHQLLRRGPRGTALTPAGEALNAEMVGLLRHVERIPEVLDAAEAAALLLNLGVPPGVPYDWFKDFTSQVQEQVSFSVYEGSSDEQLRMLADGVIDVALVHYEPDALPSRRILSQSLGCVFVNRRRMPATDNLRFTQLDGLRILAQSRPEEQIRLRSVERLRGAKVKWMFRTYSHHGLLLATTSGADAVLATRNTAEKDFAGLPWLPLETREPVSSLSTWAVWREEHRHLDLCLRAMETAAQRNRVSPG